MKLKVDDLRVLQKELDQRIFELHKVSREQTKEARILALLVELSELANETRCFKYWSLKKPSEKAVILEEYGDGVHFLLSLGIDLGDNIAYLNVNPQVIQDLDLTTQILITYEEIVKLKTDFSLLQYETAFQAYLTIAIELGFTEEDIRDYYLLKNKKNHQRQDENY